MSRVSAMELREIPWSSSAQHSEGNGRDGLRVLEDAVSPEDQKADV